MSVRGNIEGRIYVQRMSQKPTKQIYPQAHRKGLRLNKILGNQRKGRQSRKTHQQNISGQDAQPIKTYSQGTKAEKDSTENYVWPYEKVAKEPSCWGGEKKNTILLPTLIDNVEYASSMYFTCSISFNSQSITLKWDSL